MKNIFKKLLSIILPLFSGLFLIGTTAVIIIIVNGYSIDINKKQLIRTGVLNIETNPADASISVNGQYMGNSNKAIPNLTVGSYSLEISKDGYFPYKRNVDIQHGLATIIVISMVKQTGADAITTIGPKDIAVPSESGLFVISPDIVPLPSPTTGTPIPTPAPNSSRYQLTRYNVERPFFENPRPTATEKMNIELPKGASIIDMSVAPTGKNILFTIENDKKQKVTNITSFTPGQSVKVTSNEQQPLDIYINDKDNKISWAENSDYLIIETKSQVISYNIKTTARVILIDKPSKGTLVWNTTKNGIIVVRQSSDTVKDNEPITYLFEQVSFNGNAIDSLVQKVSLNDTPDKIWAEPVDEKTTIIALSCKKSSYILGNLYDNRSGEYEINLASQKIENKEIKTDANNISVISLQPFAIDNVMFNPTRFMISYTDPGARNLYTFTYNKRIAEHYVALGDKILISNNDTDIFPVRWVFSANYLLFTSNKNLWAVDFTASNLYQLQNGVNIPSFYLEDSTLIYKGDDSKLYFKLIR